MHPTDRGMCCSFNKQKADMMFKSNRYQDQIMKMTEQDKKMSFEDSAIPDWYTHMKVPIIVNSFDVIGTILSQKLDCQEV